LGVIKVEGGEEMKNKTALSILFATTITMVVASCQPASREVESYQEVDINQPVVEEQLEEVSMAESDSGDSDIYRVSGSDSLTIAARSNRMIIKNAEVKLLVEDTDTAIDRATQIVSDVGGYIISSRVWYDMWGEDSYKYSTITIGVPVNEFERTLRRLRDIAIKVLDENATGEDVTDQFVDLESQLENLEATQDRIRGFLDQAKTVEEALSVNKELSEIEAQIEEIKGRINYLSDRAAYSKITISIEPELEELPTPTVEPTSTPEAWRPSETFDNATKTLKSTYQGLIDIAIWLAFVILPVLAPFVLIAWLVWYLTIKKPSDKKKKDKDNA
jgi:hypothetical protein